MSRITYKRVDDYIVNELSEIAGKNNIIYNDPEKMEVYSHDEIADKKYGHMPEVVVKPSSAQEISNIMKLANKHRIPVTPRGAGSGLSGGAVPVYGGILLSLERMNKILEIDQGNLMMVLEPGVITNDINELLKDYGLFYAGYPMSLETCFIGGNVAENAGGGKAVKYGVTGRYIYGLEVVTPTGEIIQLGGKRVKDVTGYNLVHLMVGSEGTLGIFTRIIVKLLPLPSHKAALLVLFKDVDTAISMVSEIMTKGKIIPTAIEFMDQLSTRTSCEYLNEKIPYESAGAMLIIEVDGTDKSHVEKEYETIGEICLDKGAVEVYVADNHTTFERIWNVRKNIAEAFKVFSPHQSLEDIVVPVAAIPEMMRRVEKLSKKYCIDIPCYGHAGDGNIHATPVKNPDWTMDEWEEILENLLRDLYNETGELGGTISGEHGIGSKKKKYMSLIMDEAQIRLLKNIKSAFDPNHILNPGKII